MMMFFIVILAASFGSFANMLIYRLPLMILNEKNDKPINLFAPASHCPNCLSALKLWQNIPLLGFVFLRRHCGVCAQPIAWRYLLVELGVVFLALLCVYFFGFSISALAYFVFLYFLWVLAWIDALYYLLPDALTLLLLWAGLLYQALFTPDMLVDAVLAGCFAYLFLYVIFYIYWGLTKKQGLGFGDMKLLSAVGVWLGVAAVSNVLIAACLLAVLYTFFTYLISKEIRKIIPFGPFIATAGSIYLFIPFDFAAVFSRLL